MKRYIEAFAFAGLFAASGSAIGASCSITTVPTLGFPNYDVFAIAATTTSQTAKFHCDNDVNITVGIGKSSTSGTIATRQMSAGGTDRLNYNIYKNAGFSVLWGDGTAGTTGLVVSTNNQNASVPIFGKIDPGQNVSVGNYADTVVLSVSP